MKIRKTICDKCGKLIKKDTRYIFYPKWYGDIKKDVCATCREEYKKHILKFFETEKTNEKAE